MKTKTISTRLGEEEVALLDDLASRAGLDRGGMTKALLRRGMAELYLEEAVVAYRSGRVTLSRAAEMASVSLWDFVARMEEHGLSLSYSGEDFDDDVRGQF